MIGYLNRPEETAAKLINGWIHTGDIREDRERVCLPDRREWARLDISRAAQCLPE